MTPEKDPSPDGGTGGRKGKTINEVVGSNNIVAAPTDSNGASPPGRQYWADRIRPHLEGAAEHLIAVGRELAAAKEALPHGQFGPLLDELGISPRMAQRFMRVATNPVLGNATRVSHLPAAIGTLEELSRWDDDDLVAALDSGEIHPGTTRQQAATPHVAKNTGDNDWYTPVDLIEAARTVMGAIDLDPASSDEANAVIAAATYYTAQTNGLTQPWAGRVWMNPPYSHPLVDQFSARLVREFVDGDVSEAVVLVNNATETVWFQRMATVAQAICFPKGRVKFWHPDKESAAPLQGQAVLYLGSNSGCFYRTFQPFGFVVPARYQFGELRPGAAA